MEVNELTINLEAFVFYVRRLASENPDKKDNITEGYWYNHRGRPHTLIGEAAYACGVSIQTLARWDSLVNPFICTALSDILRSRAAANSSNADIVKWLCAVQDESDSRWADAVARADRKFPGICQDRGSGGWV